MVDALHPFDDTLNDPQRLAEQASGSGKPLDLITLRTDDSNNVAPAIGNLPGVVITPQAELLPTDYHFAPALVNQVKKAVIDELDGQAGWRVVSVNQNNVDLAVLHEVEPSAGPVGVDQPGPGRAERRPACGGQPESPGDDRRDQTLDGGDPRGRAERRGRRRRTACHHRPLPAGVDVQDGHRGCGARARHGKP